MNRLLGFLKSYRQFVALAIVSNILMSVFQVASIPFLQLFLKILFGQNGPAPAANSPGKLARFEAWMSDWFTNMNNLFGKEKALFIVCLVIVFLFLGKNLFRYLSLYWLAPVRFGIVRDLRQKLVAKIMQLPLSWFTENRKGDLMSRVTSDVMEIEWSILNVIEAVAREPIAIVGSLAFMLYISPGLTGFVIVLIAFTGAIIGGLGNRLRKQSGEAQARLGGLVSTVEETISGLRIIKGFNAESFQTSRFDSQNDDYRQLLIKMGRRRDLAAPLSEFLGIGVFVVLLLVGSRQVFAGEMAAETFITFLYAFFSVIDPAKNLSSASYNIRKGRAALDRVDSILDAEITIFEKPDALPIARFAEKIEFKNVSFFYQNSERAALHDINLTIEKGKIVALVGSSGAGKSTLADLLPRFYDPTSGQILLDEIDIKSLKINDLRGLMGIVTQEAILFNDSVFNNIAFGNEAVSEAAVEAAARAANAHEFIEKMERGYASNIGDRGQKLSGGQRQRLTIARAILKNPPILILDEATSALDSESEKLVQEALTRLMAGRTTILIAHRLSTIQHADEILVMDNGRIAERGNHDFLMKNGRIYPKLVELQAF